MKKAIKIVLWLFGALVALAIIAAVVLPMFLDPNDFRDDIGNAVAKQTGRELQIDGDLELSVIPWLGVRVGPARLSNAAGFGDEPMLAIEGAAVSVKLMPLLSKQLEISRVELDGLRLNLRRLADGTSNWDDLVASEEAPAEPPADAAAAPAFDIQEIAGIGITDVAVVYDDEAAGEAYRVALAEFDTGRITGITATPAVEGLKLSGANVSYEGGEAGRFAVTLDQFSAGDLSGDADQVDVQDLSLEGAQVEFEDPTGKLEANLGRLSTDAVTGSTAAPRIAGLALADADVKWNGGKDGRVRAVIKQLESGAIALDPEAPEIDGVKLSNVNFNYNAGKQGKAKGKLASLSTGRIVAKADAPVVEGLKLENAEVDYDAGAEETYRAVVSALELGNLSGGTPVPVSLKATATAGTPPTSIDLDLKAQAAIAGSAVTVTGLDAGLGLEGEQIPDGKQAGSLKAERLAFDGDSQEFALGGLVLSFVGLEVDADLSGTQTEAGPKAAGSISIAQFSPRALMKKVGAEVPETADPDVLKKASLRSDVALDGELLKLDGLKATLDDTTLNGRLDVTTGQRLVLNTTLKVDAIDLDRYLPPESDEEAPPAETGPTEIPTEELKGMQVNASLQIGRVKVANLKMSDVVATAQLKGGRLVLDPLGANLYDGKLAGRVVLATRTKAKVPQLRVKQKMTKVAIGPLLTDLSEVSRVTGTANLDIDLTARGADSDQMMAGLNGNVGFIINNGKLVGFNLTQALAQGVALLKGGKAPANAGPDTKFNKLSGTAVFADGVMTNEDFRAVVPGIRVSGGGKVDLAQQAIDYEVVAAVQKGKKADNVGLGEISGEKIPVRIKGPLDDPSIRPDLTAVIGDQVRDTVLDVLGLDDKDKKKNKNQDGEEKEENDLKKRLENLIGG